MMEMFASIARSKSFSESTLPGSSNHSTEPPFGSEIPVSGLFQVEGPIRDGAHLHLRNVLIRYIEEGQSKFVVDMSRAESLDSAAIGELVTCLKRAREYGGDLKLVVRPDGIVHELLQLMHLDQIFQIFPRVPHPAPVDPAGECFEHGATDVSDDFGDR